MASRPPYLPRKEAEENADWPAVDNRMRLQELTARSFTREMLSMFRPCFAAGHGTCPVIGTPDEVAVEIKRFHDAGFAGMPLSFVDDAGELPYLAQEVLPRLENWVCACPVNDSYGPKE